MTGSSISATGAYRIDHGRNEFAIGPNHINGIEGFGAQSPATAARPRKSRRIFLSILFLFYSENIGAFIASELFPYRYFLFLV
jgi:hypothetical protein